MWAVVKDIVPMWALRLLRACVLLWFCPVPSHGSKNMLRAFENT